MIRFIVYLICFSMFPLLHSFEIKRPMECTSHEYLLRRTPWATVYWEDKDGHYYHNVLTRRDQDSFPLPFHDSSHDNVDTPDITSSEEEVSS